MNALALFALRLAVSTPEPACPPERDLAVERGACDAHDARACAELGARYHDARGVERDDP